MSRHRDHGGGLDAAVARFGGEKSDWIDLSTGINPKPFPIGKIDPTDWTALPDAAAQDHLVQAARDFWAVPAGAAILAVPGASSAIARIPALWPKGRVEISKPTYNEHEAAFDAAGWDVIDPAEPQQRRRRHPSDVFVAVHPNNPDGTFFDPLGSSSLGISSKAMVIDESFCDVTPDRSHIARAAEPGTLILKSFGKFWGLAGLRLGFVIGDPALIDRLAQSIGPWAVSGPALKIGAQALEDRAWANATRLDLSEKARRMDDLVTAKGAQVVGGTSLFRLYAVDDARAWQARLADGRIWSRVFPYSDTWVRLGLPPDDGWSQLEGAL